MTAQELKNAILMRAVQGKLVPQDPNDEPASVLLEKIRTEKEQLMKEKKIKKEVISNIYKDPSDNQHYEKIGKDIKCIEDEISFEIPESWGWARLGTVFSMQAGKNIQASNIFEDISESHPYLCYGGNGIRGYVSNYNREGSFPLIGRQGALCGNIKHASGKFYATEHAVVVSTYSDTNIRWGCLFLEALKLNQYATATAQPGLAVSKILTVLIPVPPCNEQYRIIERIDSFTEPLAEYESANMQLNNLNNTINAEIKKSILQYAIQGKLVPQDPNDEPASVLLERIQAEKEQMIKDSKIKRDKNESYIYRGSDNLYYEVQNGQAECIDCIIPFEIPNSWCWCRLENVSQTIHYGFTASSQSVGNTKLLRITDIQDNQVNWQTVPYCNASDNELLTYKLNNRDILIARTGGTIGKTYIVTSLVESAVFASYLIRAIPMSQINEQYIKLFMETPEYWKQLKDKSMGTGQPNVNGNALKKLLIPIPPADEQIRILRQTNVYGNLLV